MVVAHVQTKNTDVGFVNGTTLATPSFGSPLTTGSKLLAFAAMSANSTVVFSDSGANTWTTLTGLFWANTGYFLCIGWADNTHGTTASLVVTATYGTSCQLRQISASEFTGLATGAPDVASAGKQSVTDPAADNAIITTQAGDLIYTAAAGDTPVTAAGAGFTLLGTPNTNTGSQAEYQVQGSAGSITPTIDIVSALQMNVISAAFKAAAGGGAAARVPAKVYNRAAVLRASTR